MSHILYKRFSLKIFLTIFSFVSGIIFISRVFIVEIFKSKFDILYQIYKEEGLITMIFSTRNQSIPNDLIPYIREKWTWVNFLFGGSNFHIARTEIEIIDLFWFFGLLGGAIYIYLIHGILIRTFTENIELRIPMLFLGLCAVFAGSFFTNAPVIPYFVVLVFQLKFTFNR
ncbi:hypothetical protein [Flavivirga amylovorans]|uniref:hypothetical protein n=1 Tax=Flavivirga amylovorans TaxID=870486 RepID=UPI0026E11299|nr:hypothetical protein [Flavivirga amylovorans]